MENFNNRSNDIHKFLETSVNTLDIFPPRKKKYLLGINMLFMSKNFGKKLKSFLKD